jgi:hypothetical protein
MPRRALVAAYGSRRGREAAAEALAYAWEHGGRLQDVEYSGCCSSQSTLSVALVISPESEARLALRRPVGRLQVQA